MSRMYALDSFSDRLGDALYNDDLKRPREVGTVVRLDVDPAGERQTRDEDDGAGCEQAPSRARVQFTVATDSRTILPQLS